MSQATPFLESLADQIKSEIDKHLTDTAETGSSTEDDAIVMSVSFDLEAMVHRLGGLLQTAFDRNKLNLRSPNCLPNGILPVQK